MNTEAILSLIADLYTQLGAVTQRAIAAEQRVVELENESPLAKEKA